MTKVFATSLFGAVGDEERQELSTFDIQLHRALLAVSAPLATPQATIVGTEGGDELEDTVGNDVIQALGGNDRITVTVGNASTNVDEILDFNVADDTIMLATSIFSAIGAGTLAAEAFRIGTEAQDADDRIVYDQATGSIFYDADGAGGAEAILFATVAAGTALTHLDFVAYSG